MQNATCRLLAGQMNNSDCVDNVNVNVELKTDRACTLLIAQNVSDMMRVDI